VKLTIIAKTVPVLNHSINCNYKQRLQGVVIRHKHIVTITFNTHYNCHFWGKLRLALARCLLIWSLTCASSWVRPKLHILLKTILPNLTCHPLYLISLISIFIRCRSQSS